MERPADAEGSGGVRGEDPEGRVRGRAGAGVRDGGPHLRAQADDGLRREEPRLRVRHVLLQEGGESGGEEAEQLRDQKGQDARRVLLGRQLPVVRRGHPQEQEEGRHSEGDGQGDGRRV